MRCEKTLTFYTCSYLRLPQGAFVTYISHIYYHLVYDSQVAVGKCVYVGFFFFFFFQINTEGELNTWSSARPFDNVVVLDYYIQSASVALWRINCMKAS